MRPLSIREAPPRPEGTGGVLSPVLVSTRIRFLSDFECDQCLSKRIFFCVLSEISSGSFCVMLDGSAVFLLVQEHGKQI